MIIFNYPNNLYFIINIILFDLLVNNYSNIKVILILLQILPSFLKFLGQNYFYFQLK